MTKELTFKQYLEYVRGPAVNFAVGTGEDRKYHCLPKYILCHYSKYFERLLMEDNEVPDDQTSDFDLPDERVLFFDTLFEFMFNRKINDYFLVPKEDRIRRAAGDETWSEEPLHCYERYIDTCMEFLQYAHKYDLGEMASDIVCPSLSIVWGFPSVAYNTKTFKMMQGIHDHPFILEDGVVLIRGSDIETIYAVTPEDHPLRAMATQAAVFATVESDKAPESEDDDSDPEDDDSDHGDDDPDHENFGAGFEDESDDENDSHSRADSYGATVHSISTLDLNDGGADLEEDHLDEGEDSHPRTDWYGTQVLENDGLDLVEDDEEDEENTHSLTASSGTTVVENDTLDLEDFALELQDILLDLEIFVHDLELLILNLDNGNLDPEEGDSNDNESHTVLEEEVSHVDEVEYPDLEEDDTHIEEDEDPNLEEEDSDDDGLSHYSKDSYGTPVPKRVNQPYWKQKRDVPGFVEDFAACFERMNSRYDLLEQDFGGD